jgi:hypothetical protein
VRRRRGTTGVKVQSNDVAVGVTRNIDVDTAEMLAPRILLRGRLIDYAIRLTNKCVRFFCVGTTASTK